MRRFGISTREETPIFVRLDAVYFGTSAKVVLHLKLTTL